MRGEGVKKLKWGAIELGGIFVNGQVTGKGYKKWRKTQTRVKSAGYITRGARTTSQGEYYIYRGSLQNSQIQGFGEFKWPDGRHYIGDFQNS